MRELKVNKKLKKKIVGYGYKNTREWTQAKIKRIIFIDIFAAIPEVAALIALVDSLFSPFHFLLLHFFVYTNSF